MPRYEGIGGLTPLISYYKYNFWSIFQHWNLFPFLPYPSFYFISPFCPVPPFNLFPLFALSLLLPYPRRCADILSPLAADPAKRQNMEFIWRWARCEYCWGKEQTNKEEEKRLVLDGFARVTDALELNEEHAQSHLWYGIMLDQVARCASHLLLFSSHISIFILFIYICI